MVNQNFDQSAILAAARQAAGLPMITKMSFHLCGEAIVHAPMDAKRMFFRSERMRS